MNGPFITNDNFDYDHQITTLLPTPLNNPSSLSHSSFILSHLMNAFHSSSSDDNANNNAKVMWKNDFLSSIIAPSPSSDPYKKLFKMKRKFNIDEEYFSKSLFLSPSPVYHLSSFSSSFVRFNNYLFIYFIFLNTFI